MGGSASFPLGSQEWYDAWLEEERVRHNAEIAAANNSPVDHDTGLRPAVARVALDHSNRKSWANRLRSDYVLVHHEHPPDRPRWWERLLYGARPTSTGRSVTQAIVCAGLPIATWIASTPSIGPRRAMVAATGTIIVVGWVMLKRNLVLVGFIAACAAAAYAFSPTHYPGLLRADVAVPHWVSSVLAVCVLIGVAGVQNIRYAWGLKLRYPEDPRLDQVVKIAGIVCLVGLIPTIIFLQWATFCPGIPGLLLLWAFLSGIPQFGAVVYRGYQEAARGMSSSYLELLRRASNAHRALDEPFSARSWAVLHEQAGPALQSKGATAT